MPGGTLSITLSFHNTSMVLVEALKRGRDRASNEDRSSDRSSPDCLIQAVSGADSRLANIRPIGGPDAAVIIQKLDTAARQCGPAGDRAGACPIAALMVVASNDPFTRRLSPVGCGSVVSEWLAMASWATVR